MTLKTEEPQDSAEEYFDQVVAAFFARMTEAEYGQWMDEQIPRYEAEIDAIVSDMDRVESLLKPRNAP